MRVRSKLQSLGIASRTTTTRVASGIAWVYFSLKHGLQFIKARLKEPSTWVAVSGSSALAYQYKDDPFTHTVVLMLGWTQRLSLAQGTYLDTLKNLSAVKDKSDEDTKAFAATPAGATSCLSLDRVQSVLSHRSALEAASTPEGGSGEVPTSGDTPKGPDGK
jgi:hypothetical protein